MRKSEQTISFSDYSSLYDLIIPKDNLLRQITDLVDFSFVWETVDCLHNIVNCTAFMLKSLLAMWKNGFHNADFGRETRQLAHRYPYRSRKSEQQNGNCI